MAVTRKQPIDPEFEWPLIRSKLALDTGWSLEYIDSLGLKDIGDIVGYQTGQNKGEAKLAKLNA